MTDPLPADEEPVPAKTETPDRPRYRKLNGKERGAAIAAGISLGAMAFVAMFLTSNEAGVAAAMLLSGVLLVLGIQGTQLGRLSKDEAGFLPIEEARNAVASTATEFARTGNADAAEELLDTYTASDPAARFSPSIARARAYTSHLDYGQRLLTALRTTGGVVTEPTGGRLRPDAVLAFPDATIVVEAKHYPSYRPLPVDAVTQALAIGRAVGADGALVVTNGAVSPGAAETFGREPVEMVQWHGRGDDAALRSAVERLVERVRSAKR